MPVLLFSCGVMSVTTAVLSDTFPLLIPPMNRASTNSVKLCEKNQMTYDVRMPH